MKTRFLRCLSCSVALLCAAASSAFAQGTAFTYQGRLNDGSSPANGTYDLTFALHSAANEATQAGGLVTKNSTAVSNGLFTVSLDFGNQFPGADRWLEIQVRTNGACAFTALAPRQPLTATPYALYAPSAGTAANAGSVAAAGIIGTIPLARLPATVVTNGASGVSFSGTFSGNGAGVTNLNLALNSGGSVAWPGGFVANSSPLVGSNPHGVESVDVNGDGKPDLISANQADANLTLLTNNGRGVFVLASVLVATNGPFAVGSADVNGDGKIDVIVATSAAHTLTVMTNNGSGGFAISSMPAAGSDPRSFTIADVNMDGKVDLIAAGYGFDRLIVLTNNGSGQFATASLPNVGSYPLSVTYADVNGDGRPDLISANSGASTLTVLTNNGSGGFVGLLR